MFATIPNSKKISTNKCVIDRQPEIVVWPFNTGSLYSTTYIITIPMAKPSIRASSQKMSTSDCVINDNRKSGKPGNSFNAESTTDNVEILTASWVFSTTASPNKVSPSDYDNYWQPQILTVPFIVLEI